MPRRIAAGNHRARQSRFPQHAAKNNAKSSAYAGVDAFGRDAGRRDRILQRFYAGIVRARCRIDERIAAFAERVEGALRRGCELVLPGPFVYRSGCIEGD
jgi:hypothetical protein